MNISADWLLGRTFIVPSYTDGKTKGSSNVRHEHIVTVTTVGSEKYGWNYLRVFLHEDGSRQTMRRSTFYAGIKSGLIVESMAAPESKQYQRIGGAR